ncbi:YbaN family protein [uncultured Alistipes sp.]|uniref:YbaN family protein n=1 Tax=uncultured Alistipes sp. TaxID=538949 RepID=UPI0026171220|nr:YbaN family protein [uncultured Alistipes sp.]
MKNHLLKIAGGLCVVLGFIGPFVPLLPTTPFLLPAAYCFSKSDPALRRRLIRKPSVGPLPARLRRGEGHPGESQNRGPDRAVELDDPHGGRASRQPADHNSAFCRIFVRLDPYFETQNAPP